MIRLACGLIVSFLIVSCTINKELSREILAQKSPCCTERNQFKYKKLTANGKVDVKFGVTSEVVMVGKEKSYIVGVALPRYQTGSEVRISSRILKYIGIIESSPNYMYYPVIKVLDQQYNIKRTLQIHPNLVNSKIVKHKYSWLPIDIALEPLDRFLLIQSDPRVYYKRFRYTYDYKGTENGTTYTGTKMEFVLFDVAGELKIEHKKSSVSAAKY